MSIIPDSLHILLIEDNPDHADLIQGYLDNFSNRDDTPVRWTCTQTLAEGLAVLDQVAGPQGGIPPRDADAIDVVLLDLSLADSTFKQTLQRLIEHAPHLPVVVLTAHDNPELAYRSLQQGAQDYLVKSQFSSEALLRTIRYAYERKRISAELERSNAELQQFASTLAHEIRSPLAGVLFCFTLLRQRYENQLDEATARLVQRGHLAVEDMMKLVENLLSFAQIANSYKLESVDSTLVLQEALENLEAELIATGGKVSKGTLPTVTADPAGLRHLFQNLIANGLRYNEDEHPQVHVTAETSEDGWRFAVHDNGIGISPQDQQRIFELFQRANTSRDGTGIGLAFCKRIIERHNGHLWVESEPGQGSTFYFTLPRVELNPAAPAPVATAEARP